jgi:hypothetical protein
MAQSSGYHTFVPDLAINLKARPASVSILPGAPTAVWVYQAELLLAAYWSARSSGRM